MKTATILLKKEEQGKIKNKVTKVLENYDNFALVEVTDEQIKSLNNEGFKVVVRSEIDNIQLGPVTINTANLRYDERGAILAHPAYEHAIDMDSGMHHYIVQFIGPVKEEWKEEIKRLGGILCDPLPSFAYIVEMNGQTRDELLKQSFIRWVGHYYVSYRLSTELLNEVKDIQSARAMGRAPLKAGEAVEKPTLSKQAPAAPNAFTVSFHTRQNLDQARTNILALGADISGASESGKIITVTFPPGTSAIVDKLQQLATLHGVKTVDALRVMQLRNNIAVRIMTDSLGSADFNPSLTGEGETIAVADTGLDTGDPATIHEDIRGRIKDIKSWPIQPVFDNYINNPGGDEGPADVDSGHGTHVAGSVLGNGYKSQGTIRGLANKADIFFQAVEQKLDWKNDADRQQYGEYLLAGLPDDLTVLFKQAYDAGARIHTNSWGGGKPGSYDNQSAAVDRFVWENKDMVILFASGNDGRDEDRVGTVKAGSITPPATAKNCISVGASENLREEFTSTYKDSWSWDFPKDPIGSDKKADNPNDIAAFSSRGPCIDGRFKPDVVAPGTYILSTKSSQAKGEEAKGWGLLPDNDPKKDFYLYMGGTSMATPLTAGAVALLRQYLRQKGFNPSASLVKAALIHTALRKPYRFSGVQNSSLLWDFDMGFGHVNLKPFISDQGGLNMKFIDGEGLKTGELKDQVFEISDSSIPFRTTLVYADYPGNGIINNLNLIVTMPNGKDYHGNQFSPPFDSAFDSGNNVETVYIPEPAAGQYKVTVLASNVSEGLQNYSLVVSGKFGSVPEGNGKIKGAVVFKSTNKPAENAEVSADTGQSVVADANGEYELSNVPTGTRSIAAIKDNCKANVKVSVTIDEAVDADTLALVCEQEPAVNLKGTVVSKSTSKPVARAIVSTDTGQSTQTEADGTYELSMVPAGDRSVTAFKSGCKCACTIVTVEKGKVATATTLRLVC